MPPACQPGPEFGARIHQGTRGMTPRPTVPSRGGCPNRGHTYKTTPAAAGATEETNHSKTKPKATARQV